MKDSKYLEEKIETAKGRISEIELLIREWEKSLEVKKSRSWNLTFTSSPLVSKLASKTAKGR
jgi:phage protein D